MDNNMQIIENTSIEKKETSAYKIKLKDYSCIYNYNIENKCNKVQIYDEENHKYTSIKDEQQIEDIKDICYAFQEKIYDGKVGKIKILNDSVSEYENKITVFSYFNDGYWTQRYIGVLHDGKNQIEIGSRFDDSDKQFFLQYVFSKTLGVDAKIFNDMKVFGSIEKTLDIFLLFMFIQQLKKALKKGIYRQYKEFFYNDSKVKGQIDVARHIRINNNLDNGRIAYHTREYTSNNMNNVLILNAYNMMKKKYPDVVRAAFQKERNLVSQIEMLKRDNPGWDCYRTSQIIKETKKKIVNSVYHDYEALRQTSFIIVRRLSINAYGQSKNEINGILIDMPRLWESFLEKTVFKDSDFSAQSEYKILREKRILRPDFYSKAAGIVIDAKYKNNWSYTMLQNNTDKQWEGTREDVFQVMAYILSLKCKWGGVIFPYKSEDTSNKSETDNEKYNIYPDDDDEKEPELYFRRIPFLIPGVSNYDEFTKCMDENVKLIREQLIKKN